MVVQSYDELNKDKYKVNLQKLIERLDYYDNLINNSNDGLIIQDSNEGFVFRNLSGVGVPTAVYHEFFLAFMVLSKIYDINDQLDNSNDNNKRESLKLDVFAHFSYIGATQKLENPLCFDGFLL